MTGFCDIAVFYYPRFALVPPGGNDAAITIVHVHFCFFYFPLSQYPVPAACHSFTLSIGATSISTLSARLSRIM